MTENVDEANPEEQPGTQVAAMVLRTLAAPLPDPAPPATRLAIVETATDWQKVGVHADWFELQGANLGIGRDRLHELVGCVAAAGEQIGLAWTSEQESERWEGAELSARRMAARAWADIRAHFSLGAAHGMANATLRTLFLSPSVAEAIQNANGRFKQFPAFSNDRNAWPTFNRALIDALVAGAVTSDDSRLIGFVDLLRTLLDDARYKALEERRGMDYHRWRPQSLPPGSGVPSSSLWVVAEGSQSLDIGGRFPVDPLAEPDLVARIATEGMDAIAETMRAWIDTWPHALEAVGAKILEID